MYKARKKRICNRKWRNAQSHCLLPHSLLKFTFGTFIGKTKFEYIYFQVPQDAQDYKDELKRIQDYVTNLYQKVMKECDNFSEDVKFWAEYKTGIKEFKPWLAEAEKKSTEGLSKPQTLDEANSMFAVVKGFEGSCHKHYKVNKTLF